MDNENTEINKLKREIKELKETSSSRRSSKETNTIGDIKRELDELKERISDKETRYERKDFRAIENYIFATKIELGRIHLEKFKDNLTKSERMALQSLKQNKEIVIKKADKNSSTLILDKKNYIEQALSQLNDGIHVHYEQIARSHCTEIYNLIESKVKILHVQSHR
ncbi:unnamed protein product [Mytilus coruscus]|uniref:Uncharacterized protein n=1 Tax=Mytilus coruscus TaxID=42192 RepID=A0A6J8DKE2_MYTCO|nr:unnamed protein product [Mytilus coruscus]